MNEGGTALAGGPPAKPLNHREMKTYKFKSIKSGEQFKVRFYPTGIFTIFDKNGEHEIGMWRRPEEEECMFRAFIFNTFAVLQDFKQADLAYHLLDRFLYNRKRNAG